VAGVRGRPPALRHRRPAPHGRRYPRQRWRRLGPVRRLPAGQAPSIDPVPSPVPIHFVAIGQAGRSLS